MLWNWHAPALWNRFTVELARALAAAAGLSDTACRKLVRVAYAKVAEFQARGLVHFHAIIRLDHPDDRAKAPGLRVTADELAAVIGEAARRTRGAVGPATGRSVMSPRDGAVVDGADSRLVDDDLDERFGRAMTLLRGARARV